VVLKEIGEALIQQFFACHILVLAHQNLRRTAMFFIQTELISENLKSWKNNMQLFWTTPLF